MLDRLRYLFLTGTLVASACGTHANPSPSQTFVSDVDHSDVKRQSISNCWLYAAASWTESLRLSHSGEILNASESYWTWWHFYNQLVRSNITTIRVEGSWRHAQRIILQHGYISEGDFIPAEGNSDISQAQSRAVEFVNKELAPGGRLERRVQRTPQIVREVLDEAFGSNMTQAETQAHSAHSLEVGRRKDGRPISLADALAGDQSSVWTEVGYPRVYGEGTIPSEAQVLAQNRLLQRVLRAVNEHQPVILSFMVDFNAIDPQDGGFKGTTLREKGRGGQGGHLVVLEDYVVDDVPGVGTIDEGDVSDELKELALQGTVRYLKVKNSWGINRDDRSITDGYTRLYSDYLNGVFPWLVNQGRLVHTNPTMSFVLPPGF